MTRTVVFLLLLAAAALPASAQTIYKCLDANGGTLISNSRVNKTCRAVVSEEAGAPPRQRTAARPTPTDFPRVGEATQRARDDDRRYILEQELQGEQHSLAQAREDLSTQAARKRPDAELAPYRDRVEQHERNIGALQKELSGLR